MSIFNKILSFKRKSKKSKCYLSIYDLPIEVFYNIIQTGNCNLLCYSGKIKESEALTQWEKIYEQFINKFGIPPQYKKHLKLKIKYCNELRKIHIQKQYYRKPFALRYRNEAEQLIKQEKQDLYEALAYLSKNMQFRIDPKVTTVAEYYGMVSILEKQARNNG